MASKTSKKAAKTAFLVVILSAAACCYGQIQQPEILQLRAKLIGFADRWANYNSRGDTPSFRDFLAVTGAPGENTDTSQRFIKIRILYWPQDNSDPKDLIQATLHEQHFNVRREPSCDETFASLSHEGEVSYLDPQLKPSRYMHLRGTGQKLPPTESVLPCYEVK
jgi:hypothetical protein